MNPTASPSACPVPASRLRRWLRLGALAAVCSSLASAADPQSYWKRTPIVKQEALTRGFIGGEGGQLILSMAVSKTSTTPGVPDLMLIGTDVGGLHRSTDGGDTWQPSMRGYGAEGAYSIVIDPRNPNRAVVMAARTKTGTQLNQLGLWLTTNKGVSWTRVWTPPTGNFGGGPKYQLAYDYLSYNSTLGYCTRVYWSSPKDGGENFGGGGTQSGAGGLYRSDNGGASWTLVNSSADVSGCFLAIDNVNSAAQTYPRLFIAGANGFRYSNDRGATFTVVSVDGSTTRKISGLTTNWTAANFVGICSGYKTYNSTNNGASFGAPMAGAGLPTGTPGASDYLNNIQCAPNNSQYMLLGHWRTSFDKNTRYYSTDRGATWQQSTMTVDEDLYQTSIHGTANVWIVNAWYPSASTADPLTDRVYGGFRSRVYRSSDKGETFQWWNDGKSDIIGREIAFNVHNRDVLAMPFQDLKPVITTAATSAGTPAWVTLNPPDTDPSTAWNNSHSSGAYAFSSTNIVVGMSGSWDGPFTLRRSIDGGDNWSEFTTVTATPGANNQLQRGAYGDPVNSGTAYWYNYRTTTSGASWAPMSGTYAPTVVLTHDNDNSGSKPLYGAKGNQVVKSTDRGATWTLVTTMTGYTHVIDLAYDHVNARLYIIADDPTAGYAQFANLFKYQGGVLTDITSSLPEDPVRSGPAASTVAVDPTDPNVVYAGRLWISHMSQASVYRSTNGGANWTIMTPQSGTYLDGGGHRTYRIRVHPTTRTAWVTTFNTGLWRIPYPTP